MFWLVHVKLHGWNSINANGTYAKLCLEFWSALKDVLNFKEFNPRVFFVQYPGYMNNSFDTDVTIQLYFRMFMTIYPYLYHIHHEVWCENVKDLLSIKRYSMK